MMNTPRKYWRALLRGRKIGTGLVLLGIIGLIILSVGVGRGTPHPAATAPAPSPGNPPTSSAPTGDSSSPTASSSGVAPTSPPDSSPPAAPAPTTINTLPAPTGAFLSSNETTRSSSEESTCNTVAGATCTLVLISPDGQTTKSVPMRATNANGDSFIADWRVGDYVNAPGNWTIYAQAAKGNQTGKSDNYVLVVQS